MELFPKSSITQNPKSTPSLEREHETAARLLPGGGFERRQHPSFAGSDWHRKSAARKRIKGNPFTGMGVKIPTE